MSFKVPLFIADKLSGHQLAGNRGAHDGTEACVMIHVSLCWLARRGVGATLFYSPLGKKAKPSINSFNPKRSWKIPVVLPTTILHIV